MESAEEFIELGQEENRKNIKRAKLMVTDLEFLRDFFWQKQKSKYSSMTDDIIQMLGDM